MKDIHDTQPLLFNHIRCRSVAAGAGSVHLINGPEQPSCSSRTLILTQVHNAQPRLDNSTQWHSTTPLPQPHNQLPVWVDFHTINPPCVWLEGVYKANWGGVAMVKGHGEWGRHSCHICEQSTPAFFFFFLVNALWLLLATSCALNSYIYALLDFTTSITVLARRPSSSVQSNLSLMCNSSRNM